MFSYLFAGKLRIPQGHVPPAGHLVPQDFSGVGVATSADQRVDDYVICRLQELGVQQVRLDFTYDDADGHVARFLEALCARSFRVMLHLVQPFVAAKRMDQSAAREAWRDFVAHTLDRFGARVEIVEIGSTVNRKRWAGYTLAGFLAAWEIAYREARARQIRLAGPSVTDFEPLFNIGLLALLRSRAQLPDIHTDNLFSERCTEPERYDHKIFGRHIASLIKVNLVKKARVLQKVGADHGVAEFHSPAAFWTLPRIGRMLPDTEEKQADYLARYMLLCAASGALQRVFWGPLICHREGLIDDANPQYPALERITHYAEVTGVIDDLRVRPAFHALKTFAALIPGCHYEGRLNTGPMLEVHAFASAERRVHAVWTINGKAAALVDIYSVEDLQTAECFSRDGVLLVEAPTLASETPIYLCWPPSSKPYAKTGAAVLKDVAIHRHIAGMTHYFFRENNWQGILLARNAGEARLLLQAIHPECIGTPPRETTLRHARNAIWTIADPRSKDSRLVVKQPVTMHLHKKMLDRLKPSKGLRSWNGSCELLRRGIKAATPVAYFEKRGDTTLKQNYYLCEYVPAEFTARELVSAFSRGESTFEGICEVDAYSQLSGYLQIMHGRGIFFRDLSGGNILIRKQHDGMLEFSVIDTGRLRVFQRALPLRQRFADLARICNKLHWAGREKFLNIYLSAIGQRLRWWHRLPFFVYDIKVSAKRRIGRKALKRLFASSDR